MHPNKLEYIFLKKQFSSKSGFGILQVLVGMSFMFLLIYAILTMLSNTRLAQKKQTVLVNVQELKARIENLLKDPTSWRNTMMDTANLMPCLRNNTICAAGGPIYVIRDANDQVVVSNLPAWTSTSIVAGGGFTEDGVFCSTFTFAGNDACPFTYKLYWEPVSTTVADPGIRIVGRLLYKPVSTILSTVVSLGAMTNTYANDVTSIGVDDSTKRSVNSLAPQSNQRQDLKMGKYDISLWRSASTNIQSFRIVWLSGSVIGCSTVPSFTAASVRTNLTSQYDPFKLAPITGNYITLRSGTYDCDVVAAGNGVGGFQVQLASVAGVAYTPVGSGASYAPTNTQTTVEFNTTFRIASPSNFVVQQICKSSGGGSGLGVNPTGLSPLASLTCRLIDE